VRLLLAVVELDFLCMAIIATGNLLWVLWYRLSFSLCGFGCLALGFQVDLASPHTALD
jgi:hypothetical protein